MLELIKMLVHVIPALTWIYGWDFYFPFDQINHKLKNLSSLDY